MLDLRMIDIIAVSSDKPIETIRSLRYSTKNVKFGNIKFLTHCEKEEIKVDTEGIEIVKIDEIKSHREYNDFCLRLNDYTQNDFTLIVQNDSFITNPEKWTNEFLKYDYIGAPWTVQQSLDWGIPNRVGNGGFSLRSKKFLEYSSIFKSCNGANEDGFLTNFTLNYAKKYGINYAPVELAQLFSIEKIEEGKNYDPSQHFGFHGNHIYKIAEEYFEEYSSI